MTEVKNLDLKNMDETKNYFFEEIKQNELIGKKHKNVWKMLNFVKYIISLAITIVGCISISEFASLISIPIGITNSAIRLKLCAIATRVKQYKSIIKK